MKQSMHPFDYVRTWSKMTEQELEPVFLEQNKKILLNASELLRPGTSTNSDLHTVREFRRTARELHQIVKSSSIALGNAMISAEDCVLQGDPDGAALCLTKFIHQSTSEFHRRIAIVELEKLRIKDP